MHCDSNPFKFLTMKVEDYANTSMKVEGPESLKRGLRILN